MDILDKIRKLIKCLHDHGVEYRHLVFSEPTRTVEDASRVSGADPSDIVKTIILVDEENRLYASIVSGNKRVDLSKLRDVLGVRDLRLAKASEVKRYLGYEIGEVPPLCLDNVSKVIVDEEILSKRRVLGGGGSINSLLEFSPEAFSIYGDKLVIAKISA
jgi:prolyl-tRNA editing enzyme YbaK/EbsC (Cys-tRNA(Pro) deacylase)